MASRLGPQRGRLGHHVGRTAGLDHTHVARAPLAVFHHEPVPAVFDERRDRQRSDRDRRHALLRGHTRMARNPFDGDVHAVAARRADRDLLDGAAVEVEGQLRLAEVGGLGEPRPVEADLLLDCEEEGQRRMRQLAFQDFDRGGEHDRAAGAVISAEPRGRVAALHEAAGHHRLRADADGHRVHVGHEEPSWACQGAGQLHDEISHVALERRLRVGRVERDGVGRAARLPQPLHDVVGHVLLVARSTGNGEQIEHRATGRRQIGLRRCGRCRS